MSFTLLVLVYPFERGVSSFIILHHSDYEYLKYVVADIQKKSAPLKENFEKCSRLCELYSEIAKTYYEISRGDYISRLVEERKINKIKQEKDEMSGIRITRCKE